MEFTSRKNQYDVIVNSNSFEELMEFLSGEFIPCGPYSIFTFLMPHYFPQTDTLKICRYYIGICISCTGELFLTPVKATSEAAHILDVAKSVVADLPKDIYLGDLEGSLQYVPLFSLAVLSESNKSIKGEDLVPLYFLDTYLDDIKKDILRFEFPNRVDGFYFDKSFSKGTEFIELLTREDLQYYLSSNKTSPLLTMPRAPIQPYAIIRFTDSGFIFADSILKGQPLTFQGSLLPASVIFFTEASMNRRPFAGPMKSSIYAVQFQSCVSNSTNQTTSLITDSVDSVIYDITKLFPNKLISRSEK